MTSQTARQDSATRPAVTGVPAQRVNPDPLVGPPVEPQHNGHRPGHEDLGEVPTGELVKRLSTQLSDLLRGELDLAKAELTEKGRRAGTGAGLAGTGGVVALYGVGALIAAAVAALALVMPVWLAALAVGVVLLIVAAVLGLAGRSQLRRATPPMPEETVENVHRDVETVKDAVQHR